MAMQIGSGYLHSFSKTTYSRAVQKPVPSAGGQGEQAEQADRVAELRTRQQQLQNQILLLRAGTDSAAATAEMQKAAETELEEITQKLRAAKGSGV